VYPFDHYLYAFAPDHTGVLAPIGMKLAPGSPTSTPFTYSIGADQEALSETEVVTEQRGGSLVRDRIRIHGASLEELGFIYWNGSEWAAPTMQYRFKCVRAPHHGS
jgi:hypothetical protein